MFYIIFFILGMWCQNRFQRKITAVIDALKFWEKTIEQRVEEAEERLREKEDEKK